MIIDRKFTDFLGSGIVLKVRNHQRMGSSMLSNFQWLSFAGNVYTGTILPIKYGGKLQDIKNMFNQFLAKMQHGLPISAPLRRFCTKPATFP